jgi:MFS transporter, DHA2 family, multidrug resistance protein
VTWPDGHETKGIGLGLTAWAFYAMTGWTPDISQSAIISVGIIQGIGLGFLFVPLSTATLGTLSPEHRTEGSGVRKKLNF